MCAGLRNVNGRVDAGGVTGIARQLHEARVRHHQAGDFDGGVVGIVVRNHELPGRLAHGLGQAFEEASYD